MLPASRPLVFDEGVQASLLGGHEEQPRAAASLTQALDPYPVPIDTARAAAAAMAAAAAAAVQHAQQQAAVMQEVETRGAAAGRAAAAAAWRERQEPEPLPPHHYQRDENYGRPRRRDSYHHHHQRSDSYRGEEQSLDRRSAVRPEHFSAFLAPCACGWANTGLPGNLQRPSAHYGGGSEAEDWRQRRRQQLLMRIVKEQQALLLEDPLYIASLTRSDALREVCPGLLLTHVRAPFCPPGPSPPALADLQRLLASVNPPLPYPLTNPRERLDDVVRYDI